MAKKEIQSIDAKTLNEKSLWYKYKIPNWPIAGYESKDERVNTIHNIMRAVRGIHNPDGFAYLSVPVTSGKVLYNLQREARKMENTPSNDHLLEKAMAENYLSGYNLLNNLIDNKITYKPVIFPADLVPSRQTWEQGHFQALWLTMIAEKCSELYMAKDWEYSNGASEEFTHVMQLKLGIPTHPQIPFYNTKESLENSVNRMKHIETYDYQGKSLTIDDGIRMIEKSLSEIKSWDFKAPKLENCLNLLYWTKNNLERK